MSKTKRSTLAAATIRSDLDASKLEHNFQGYSPQEIAAFASVGKRNENQKARQIEGRNTTHSRKRRLRVTASLSSA
jgi:hypothetical protein